MDFIKATNLDRKSAGPKGGICNAPCGFLKFFPSDPFEKIPLGQQTWPEPIEGQEVYVFPAQNSKKLGRKTEGRLRLFGMPGRILHSRQDKNENENRFRAFALSCAYRGWRHLDDGAAGSHGTCCSSTQASR